MRRDEEEIVRHTMKSIADRDRKHMEWRHGMLDEMYKLLNWQVPEGPHRRKTDEEEG